MNSQLMKKYIVVNVKNPKNESHPWHEVRTSPWPILTSIYAMYLVLTYIFYVENQNYFCIKAWPILLHVFLFLSIMFLWLQDVIQEGAYEGNHTIQVQKNLRFGFALFILSEVMFFFSFFWTFFHSSLSPAVGIGCQWPPENVEILDSWGLPFVNTLILLSSGVTVTISHVFLTDGLGFVSCKNVRLLVIVYLAVTIIQGAFFMYCQYLEYHVAPFSLNDTVYGSIFYLITGFHGFHVFVGMIMLIVCLVRFIRNEFTVEQHVGFEATIWYWHFVDFIWLYVFTIIYYWGGAL